MRFTLALGCTVCLNLLLACGGSNSHPTPGTLTLRLGSDSIPGYTQAVVSVQRVDASGDGGTWVGLGTVSGTFDLMALQNGHTVALLPGVSVDSGTYRYFRITWDTANHLNPINLPAYAVDTQNLSHPLAMPAAMTTVVTGNVAVPPNGSATAQIMVSGTQAIQIRPVAGVATHVFQAVGQAFDPGVCARITGSLSPGLSGVEVYAETVDGTGLATIQRRALTDSSGSFALEALPTESLYYVVGQPAGTTSAYAAAASAGIDCALALPYGPVSLSYSTAQAPGALNLAVTPPSAAADATWGELRQSLSTGGSGSQTLIVRSQTVATSATQDLAGFAGLAPGNYGYTAQRSRAGAPAVMKIGASQVAVPAGAPGTVSLTYP